jgi:hypothetical protein
MKKLLSLFVLLLMMGCHKDDFLPSPEINQVKPELKIQNSVGIKLESAFVTSEVAMNVKTDYSGAVTIKILDIANRVVSKETAEVKSGDNILKVYTTALPNSAYRIALYDNNGIQLGITDFNKIN